MIDHINTMNGTRTRNLMNFQSDKRFLAGLELGQRLKKLYSGEFDSGYDSVDWQRCAFASLLCEGSTIADIGTGTGMFLHYAKEVARAERVLGVDVARAKKLILPEGCEYEIGSLISEGLSVGRHDTVVCMEVLEHLPPDKNAVALDNLRRARGRRLIVSVPLLEPRPLWREGKADVHKQAFTVEKLATLFPRAVAGLMPRYGVSWIIIVEDAEPICDYFQIVSRERLYATHRALELVQSAG